MLQLTTTQYDVLYAAFAGAFAALAGAFIYFIFVRTTLNKDYHPAMAVAAVVVAVAAMHYLRIINNFQDTLRFEDGKWVPTGIPFANGFRYIDWIITVPLLMAQFVLVLRLERLEAARLLRSLMIAAALMIGLGYPGEISNNTGVKLAFWAAGFVPFAYIVYVLWVGLNRSLFRYSDDVALAVARARMLLVGIWLVYPVAYLFPILGIDSVTGEMSRQILYSLADVIAKAGFGLFIYRIARLLTDEDPYARSLKNEYQVDLADAGRGLEAKF